jgi:zinc protease
MINLRSDGLLLTKTNMEPLLASVTEYEKNGMRFFAARMGAKDVVTIEGSVLGGYRNGSREKEMVQRLLVGVLDAGTKKHGKDAFRELLASKGASLSFGTGATRTYFSASCLPEDVAFICDLLVECLSIPLLANREIEGERTRILAELEEAKTDTRQRASAAFSQMLFDKQHPNYSDSLETEIARTQKITKADVVVFHKMLGHGGLLFAITGDIQPDKALRTAEKAFLKLPAGTATPMSFNRNVKSQSAHVEKIVMKDKATIDTYLGIAVPITKTDALYVPLAVLVSMIGGPGLSSGHLMRTIRERDGLTYGIYSYVNGFDMSTDGYLQIWATFSPATFEEAVEKTRAEIKKFLATGVTEEALARKQDELRGKYIVGLSTSHGLAATLHAIGKDGRPLSYIDEYPVRISNVTLKDLKDAVALIDLSKMSLAAAGTFAPSAKK